jgi:hypothetical protein
MTEAATPSLDLVVGPDELGLDPHPFGRDPCFANDADGRFVATMGDQQRKVPRDRVDRLRVHDLLDP